MDAIRVIGRTVSALYDDLFLLVVANVLWLVISLPVVTLPPAKAALFALTNRLANGRHADLGDFWAGFREYFGRAWQLMAADAIVPALILANLSFYAHTGNTLIAVVRGVWMVGLVAWLCVQPYLFPLLMEQADRRLRVTVRNAALMALSAPLLTLILLTVTAFIVFSVAALPPLAIMAVSFLALLYNTAVVTRLEGRAEKEGKQVEEELLVASPPSLPLKKE